MSRRLLALILAAFAVTSLASGAGRPCAERLENDGQEGGAEETRLEEQDQKDDPLDAGFA